MFIEVYTKEDCSFCKKSKNLLNKKNIPFTEYRLDVHFTREIILEKYHGVKSFPVIVVDGFRIGGFMELEKMLKEQEKIVKSNQILLNEG